MCIGVVGTSVVRNDHSTRDSEEKTQPPANHYGNIPLYHLAKLPAVVQVEREKLVSE